MSKKKLLLVIPVILLFSVYTFIYGNILKNISENKSIEKAKYTSSNTHKNLFFDEKSFNQGVMQTAKENKLSNYRISGGIIPHHLLPGFIITDFFNRLSKQNPKTIILIGPNHYEKGEYNVLSSLYAWETPFGKVYPEDEIINKLIKKQLIKVDEKVLLNDHAVAGIMPFISFYLPNTKVVPLLISSRAAQEDVGVLADNLADEINEEIVLVAAVDFSHYLNNEQAKEKDKLTLEVIRKYDYRQLFTLNSDYLDSPPSIAAILMVMQKLKTTKMEVLHNTNSGELAKDDFIETTSYYSITYYK